MRLPTTHSKRLVSAAAMAGAGVLATAALALTTFSAAAASTPACTAAGTVVWIDTTGSGTAGSIFYALQFTNLSGHSCTISGYPGVSGVDLRGHQLGSPASRNPQHKAAVIALADGSGSSSLDTTALAVLQVTDVGNYPAAKCKQTAAAGLRVYMPGQKASSVVPFPFRACGKTGANYLSVQAIQGGVGSSG
jgi:hypothetical protein